MKVVFVLTGLVLVGGYTLEESVFKLVDTIRRQRSCASPHLGLAHFADPQYRRDVVSQRASVAKDLLRTYLEDEHRGVDALDYLVRQVHASQEIDVTLTPTEPGGKLNVKGDSVTIGMYVLFLDTRPGEGVEYLRNALAATDVKFLWKVRACFLVVLSGESSREAVEKSARDVLKDLKIFGISRVVIMRLNRGDRTEHGGGEFIDVYRGVTQMGPGYRCGEIRGVAMINRWSIDRDVFLEGRDVFPKYTPSALKGCHLTVSIYPYKPYAFRPEESQDRVLRYTKGIEVQVLWAVAETLNFEVRFQTLKASGSGWGVRLPDGTLDGILSHVLEGRSDVAFGTAVLSIDKITHFDYTFPYATDEYVWFVPKAEPFPRWMSLYRIFSSRLWLSVLLGYVANSSVFYLFLNGRPSATTTGTRKTLSECFFAFWSVILGTALAYIPRDSIHRAFFVLWVYFCFIVNASYQSFLIGVLTNPGSQHQISTVNEMLESGIGYGYYPSFDSIYQDDLDPRSVEILKNRVSCLNISYCVRKIVLSKDFAFLGAYKPLHYMIMSKVLNEFREPLVMPLREKVKNVYLSMYLAKGAPFLAGFDRVIVRAVEGGLLDKWYGDIMRELVASKRAPSSSRGTVILTLDHLQGAFCLLAAGLSGALVVFLREVCPLIRDHMRPVKY